MIAHLKKYSLAGNEFKWQFRLQKHMQRSGESLVEYAGSLRALAEKAYPAWSLEQRRDALRNKFIQGVQSSSVQLHLMREKPLSLNAALEVAIHRKMSRLHRIVSRRKSKIGEPDGTRQGGGLP